MGDAQGGTKQELQERGNALDEHIRRSEKDLKLLYKSLRHLNKGNAKYKHKLTAGVGDAQGGDGEHDAEMAKMEYTNKFRKITNSLFKHRERLKQLKGGIEENQLKLGAAEQQSDLMQNHIVKYSENEAKLDKKLLQQKAKLRRAVTQQKHVELSRQLQLAELRRREKSMVEMLKYLDDLLQSHNVHIEELSQMAASAKKLGKDREHGGDAASG